MKKENEKNEIAEYTVEKRDASPSQLLIKIESFSFLSEQYESREFAAGGYKWKLVIHRNGDDISVDLATAQTNSLPINGEVNAMFIIFLYNQISDNYLCFRGKVQRFHAMKSKWGLSNLLSKKNLNDPCNGFLVDNKCVFGAEVFVIKSQRVIKCVSMLKPKYWKFSNFFKLKGVRYLEQKARTSATVLDSGTQSSLPIIMALHPPDDENENPEFTMEIRDTPPSHLLIKIESFSILWKHGIQKYKSMEFPAGGYKWRLIIYPDGDYISADLVVVRTSSQPMDWEVNAIFNIFLYNQIPDNYLCFRGKMRHFHAMKSEWGLSRFLSKKSLTDPSNGYLVNDSCVFGAEVFVIKSQRVTEYVSVLKLTDPYKHEWKVSNFSKLGWYWASEVFTVGGYEWEINLFPNGYGGYEIGRSVSLLLRQIVYNRERVKVNCCLRIKNQLHNDHCSKSGSLLFTYSQPMQGWNAFLPIGDMLDQTKGFVVNDCCLLEAEISVQLFARDAP